MKPPLQDSEIKAIKLLSSRVLFSGFFNSTRFDGEFQPKTDKESPMLTKTFLAFCLLCAFILIGCSKSEPTNNSNSMTSNSNKPTTATTSTTAASGDKIGVPECDDFLAKYEACVSGKVPEAGRAAFNSSLKQWRDSWKKLADNPQTKGTLAAVCKQSAEQARTSMKTYGCEF